MSEVSESVRAVETLTLVYPELSESVRAGETLTHSFPTALPFPLFSLIFLLLPSPFVSCPFPGPLLPCLPASSLPT